MKTFYNTDKCFFNQDLVCVNPEMPGYNHYCRECPHLPNLEGSYIHNADPSIIGSDVSYHLLIAVGSSRERHEKEYRISSGSRKVPKWAKELCDGSCGFLDHIRLLDSDDGFRIFYEPYWIRKREIDQLLDICERYNLTYEISGRSSHMPGMCVRIELKEKD